MNRRTCFLLALPTVLKGAPALTGRWRSVTTTRGGIGAVYDFQPNGRAVYHSAAMIEVPYRLEGDQLNLGGQMLGVGWHADGRLQLNYGGNQVEDFTRQGHPVDRAQPLLGEWKGFRAMSGQRLPVTLQFRTGGQALTVILLKGLAGRYQRGDDAWTLTLPSLPARRITEDAGTGQLIIQAVNGDPHRFARL